MLHLLELHNAPSVHPKMQFVTNRCSFVQPKGAYCATEGNDGTKRVQSRVQVTIVSGGLHGAKWRSWVQDKSKDRYSL